MAKFKAPSAAVLAARSRRTARAGRESDRTQWFVNEVSDKISLTLRSRVRLATEFVKTKIVKNISIPVGRKEVGISEAAKRGLESGLDLVSGSLSKSLRSVRFDIRSLNARRANARRIQDREAVDFDELAKKLRTKRTLIERSKPGEFPRADTTQLLRTIFTDYKQAGPGTFDGFVGSPLDYSLRLELKMNRSFLRRTLNEERSTVIRILTGPIK